MMKIFDPNSEGPKFPFERRIGQYIREGTP